MGGTLGSPSVNEMTIQTIDRLISSQPLQTVEIDGEVLDLTSIDPNYGQPLTEEFEGYLAAFLSMRQFLEKLRELDMISDVNVFFDLLRAHIDMPTNALTESESPTSLPPILTRDVSLIAKYMSNLIAENDNRKHMRYTSRLEADFEMIGSVGKGGYGVVVRAINKFDKREYAIKKIKVRNGGTVVMREVMLLAKLDHINVNRYHSVWLDYEEIPQKGVESADSSSSSESSIFEKEDDDQSQDFVWADEERCENSRDKSTSTNSEQISKEIFPTFGDNGNLSESVSDSDGAVLPIKYIINPRSEFKSPLRRLSRSLSYPLIKSHIINPTPQSFTQERDHPLVLSTPHRPELRPILCIQLELCETNLQEWLKKRNEVSTSIAELTDEDVSTANNYLTQFYRGLEYLHSQNCIHRDIKPTNILLTSKLHVLKICDFGFSKEIIDEESTDSRSSFTSSYSGSIHTSNIGTQPYISPEQLNSTDYTSKTDLFSSALVFLELYHPFSSGSERVAVFDKAKAKLRELPEDFREKFHYESILILEMLNWDWEERPSASEVLERLPDNTLDLLEENKQLRRKVEELEAKLKASNKSVL